MNLDANKTTLVLSTGPLDEPIFELQNLPHSGARYELQVSQINAQNFGSKQTHRLSEIVSFTTRDEEANWRHKTKGQNSIGVSPLSLLPQLNQIDRNSRSGLVNDASVSRASQLLSNLLITRSPSPVNQSNGSHRARARLDQSAGEEAWQEAGSGQESNFFATIYQHLQATFNWNQKVKSSSGANPALEQASGFMSAATGKSGASRRNRDNAQSSPFLEPQFLVWPTILLLILILAVSLLVRLFSSNGTPNELENGQNLANCPRLKSKPDQNLNESQLTLTASNSSSAASQQSASARSSDMEKLEILKENSGLKTKDNLHNYPNQLGSQTCRRKTTRAAANTNLPRSNSFLFGQQEQQQQHQHQLMMTLRPNNNEYGLDFVIDDPLASGSLISNANLIQDCGIATKDCVDLVGRAHRALDLGDLGQRVGLVTMNESINSRSISARQSDRQFGQDQHFRRQQVPESGHQIAFNENNNQDQQSPLPRTTKTISRSKTNKSGKQSNLRSSNMFQYDPMSNRYNNIDPDGTHSCTLDDNKLAKLPKTIRERLSPQVLASNSFVTMDFAAGGLLYPHADEENGYTHRSTNQRQHVTCSSNSSSSATTTTNTQNNTTSSMANHNDHHDHTNVQHNFAAHSMMELADGIHYIQLLPNNQLVGQNEAAMFQPVSLAQAGLELASNAIPFLEQMGIDAAQHQLHYLQSPQLTDSSSINVGPCGRFMAPGLIVASSSSSPLANTSLTVSPQSESLVNNSSTTAHNNPNERLTIAQNDLIDTNVNDKFSVDADNADRKQRFCSDK